MFCHNLKYYLAGMCLVLLDASLFGDTLHAIDSLDSCVDLVMIGKI